MQLLPFFHTWCTQFSIGVVGLHLLAQVEHFLRIGHLLMFHLRVVLVGLDVGFCPEVTSAHFARLCPVVV